MSKKPEGLGGLGEEFCKKEDNQKPPEERGSANKPWPKSGRKVDGH